MRSEEVVNTLYYTNCKVCGTEVRMYTLTEAQAEDFTCYDCEHKLKGWEIALTKDIYLLGAVVTGWRYGYMASEGEPDEVTLLCTDGQVIRLKADYGEDPNMVIYKDPT